MFIPINELHNQLEVKFFYKFQQTGSVKGVQRSDRPEKLNDDVKVMVDLTENSINSMSKLT